MNEKIVGRIQTGFEIRIIISESQPKRVALLIINPEDAEVFNKFPLDESVKIKKESDKHFKDKKNLTCDTCFKTKECIFAFDLYNTNGDCLAMK